MDFLGQLNWLAVGQIILIDILLGGDNASVIALACRNLPPELRIRGILWGTVGAIAMRIVLIIFAVALLQVPYLKFLGGLFLLWIGLKLLSENEGNRAEIQASDRLLIAIKTIVVADLVVSIDNVIAVASSAEQADGAQSTRAGSFWDFDQYSHHRMGQYNRPETDGALSNYYYLGCCLTRLPCWRDDVFGYWPCTMDTRETAVS